MLASAIDELRDPGHLNLLLHDELEAVIVALVGHIDYCAEQLNTPEVEDFLMGVQLEAAHQEQRWGTEHDEGKTPEDWFWLLGYLMGKAVRAANAGDSEKHRHHLISTGAVLANWHRHAMGAGKFQPGYLPASQTGDNPSALTRGNTEAENAG